MKQRIALLGSTGSIGRQTLDIVRNMPDSFEITALTAHSNWELLARQAAEFEADCAIIADERYYPRLKEALAHHPIKVYAGHEAIIQTLRGDNIDTVVNALVGYAGLMPSAAALETGKKLALANKESLVVAGEQIMRLAAANNAPILPVDSEHSAVFQCLTGENSPIRRIILTASGGPFLDTPAEQLADVTVEQALAHPRWKMGAKITIDSATLMNKGFEVIEARWLFGVGADKIDVAIHPESIIHSMVEFGDGAIKAQLGTPDMHLPIQYALTYPARVDAPYPKFDLFGSGFTFRRPDTGKFPALRLAYDCLARGGNSCCILNAADEVAVAAFLAGRIGYNDIIPTMERTLERATFIASPSLADCAESNAEAREIAGSLAG